MVIGLSGYKGSGKTTLADKLVRHDFFKVSFKDGLIAELMDTMPDVLRAMCYEYGTSLDRLFRDKPVVMRALLQNYGTNLRRAENPRYWVDKWVEKVANLPPRTNVVVDDVRFFNEAEAVREMGGVLIRVIKEGQRSTDPHQSEVEHTKINFDFTITAPEGDVQTLYDGFDKAIQTIKDNVD